MPIEILGSNRHQKIEVLNWSMWLQPLQFNNLLFPNGNTYIQKQLKNPADIRFYSKRQNNVTKPNDHINMNSTIAGSVNAGSYMTITYEGKIC
jgi:hypothetical protein